MRHIHGKPKYLLRIISVILLTLFGAYSCNVALFNAWQTSMPDNTPYLDQLSLRFWLFALFSCLAFGCALIVLVMTIRRMNKNYKQAGGEGHYDSNDPIH